MVSKVINKKYKPLKFTGKLLLIYEVRTCVESDSFFYVFDFSDSLLSVMYYICFYENCYYFLDEANFDSFDTDLQSTSQLDSEDEIKVVHEEPDEFGKNSFD